MDHFEMLKHSDEMDYRQIGNESLQTDTVLSIRLKMSNVSVNMYAFITSFIS